MGLDAFEYQCGHSVRLGVDKAGKMAADAAEQGILFSHALLYQYVQPREEKLTGRRSLSAPGTEVCRALGGRRIIFHSGSAATETEPKPPSKERWAPCAVPWKRWTKPVWRYDSLPGDRQGKIGQLGTLDEVLTLCGVDKRIATIDFSHLNARTLGGISPGPTTPPSLTGWVRCWATARPAVPRSPLLRIGILPAAEAPLDLC